MRRSKSCQEGKHSQLPQVTPVLEAGEGGSTAAPFPCTPTLANSATAGFEANLKTRFFLTHVDQSWKMKLLSVTARSPLSISDRNAYFLRRNPQLA